MHIDASSRKLQARELCVAKRKQPLLSALLDTGGVVKIAEPLPASLAMALTLPAGIAVRDRGGNHARFSKGR